MANCDIEIPPLPLDILFFHILPRFPGKSVHRFLCVCKQWRSFLTTPAFVKMHHHHRHKLLIAFSTTPPCKFSTIDMEAHQHGLSASHPVPFKIPNGILEIVESIRGLVCVRMRNKCNEREYSDIILWNPLTSEYKTVSRPNNEECYVTTATLLGFYYSCNDYKLLLVTNDHNVYMYSLKSDSWRKVETTKEDLSLLRDHLIHHYRWWLMCCSLNEKMYLNTSEPNRNTTMGDPIIIITFDMKTEKWRKIVGPCIGNGPTKITLSFMVVRECIHLCMKCRHYDDKYPVELWRMDGDGDGDGDWTKVVDTSNQPYSFPGWDALYPVHSIKNGNWVMYYDLLKIFYEADLEMRNKKEVYSCDPDTIIATRCTYIETLGINMFN